MDDFSAILTYISYACSMFVCLIMPNCLLNTKRISGYIGRYRCIITFNNSCKKEENDSSTCILQSSACDSSSGSLINSYEYIDVGSGHVHLPPNSFISEIMGEPTKNRLAIQSQNPLTCDSDTYKNRSDALVNNNQSIIPRQIASLTLTQSLTELMKMKDDNQLKGQPESNRVAEMRMVDMFSAETVMRLQEDNICTLEELVDAFLNNPLLGKYTFINKYKMSEWLAHSLSNDISQWYSDLLQKCGELQTVA
ncbi:hypothetical protein GJ496_002077 [Pomphorhynchus laevis]|nr:hypothetical protein GJ496_002077 [Pomphorhynchus laevis]